MNADFIGSDLILVNEQTVGAGVNTQVNLEKIPFEPDFKETNSDYQVYLDRKITEASTGVSMNYNSTIRVTEITVPYNLDENMVAVWREFAPAVFARYASTTSNNTVTVTLANHGFLTDDQVEVALPT